MGVRGLWEVVAPVARPITLESLANKRLAVDASIWIYQFLKAVRDANGNVLKNAHVIGFFRRICKLLYFGIKPVFVFDGEAPMLKRRTIAGRQQRRLGKQESASKTAAKVLSVQLQRMAEAAAANKKISQKNTGSNVPDVTENAVYYDELNLPSEQQVNAAEKTESKGKVFRPHDQYHLPEVETPLHIDENDPRLMTEQELEQYAREFQFSSGLELYDTSKIDFNSPEFKMLPKTTQFQLLNVARLRSRLRMGYSADQLSTMFPDKMEFSKFQVQRVAQRNFLTQKILSLVGFEEDLSQRLAGEKGGRYVLQKNDAEKGGGWILALENPENKSGVIELDTEAIDTEATEKPIKEEDVSDEDIWEAVPISTVETKNIPTISASSNGKTQQSSEDIMPVPFNAFEDNVQREKLYEKLAKSTSNGKSAGNQEPPISKPKKKFDYQLASEQDILSKLFSAPSSSKNEVTNKADSDELFGGSLPLLDEKADSQKDKGEDTKKKPKAAEILPPWFENKNDTVTVPASTNRTAISSENEDDREEIITMDKANEILRKRRNFDEADDGVLITDEKRLQTPIVEEIDAESPLLSPPIHNQKGLEPEPVNELETPSADVSEKIIDRGQGRNSADSISVSADSEDDFEEIEVEDAPRPFRDSSSRKADILPIERDKQETVSLDNDITQNEDSNPTVAELDPVQLELANEEEQYDNEEEEELVENMVKEVEESERFAKTLNNGIAVNRDYEEEIRNLKKQQVKAQRDSDMVTSEMISECQELLTRFGIPYITAPTEAEAQCAELSLLGLVDGIITDDSDCFLFGGNRVYKNMFNQSKFVECYELDDIENELGLSRQKLIYLAMLLGSDYTDGLPGIGPVTAVELLAEFGSDPEPLRIFQKWWTEIERGKVEQETSEFRKKFRQRFGKKLFLPADFCNDAIERAYLHPVVDDDQSKFVWGVPDLDSLRKYLTNATGWPLSKVNELLVPVIKDINKRIQNHKQKAQSSLLDFGIAGLPTRKKLEIASSGRMKRAMERLIDDGQKQEISKKRKTT